MKAFAIFHMILFDTDTDICGKSLDCTAAVATVATAAAATVAAATVASATAAVATEATAVTFVVFFLVE